MALFDLPPWPHQAYADQALDEFVAPGRALCVTSPTGGGKSRMQLTRLLKARKPMLATQRTGLFDQLAEGLTAAGIEFGMRAAKHKPRLGLAVQLSMMQTELSRWGKMPLHDCDELHIDEGHNECNTRGLTIASAYRERGACVVYWTATPLGMEGHVDKLIIAGTNSELRACGALVPAYHYGCDEPDTSQIKRQATGEYKVGDIKRLILTHTIVGRVIDNYNRLNPERRPTLLFAPGVGESVWFAEQLTNAGIRAGHIDGDNVWLDGEIYESDPEARKELKRLVEAGEVKVVCNRFVMREGQDWPFVSHLIFCTIFGGLVGYLQSGGRGLRACNAGPWAGKASCTVQDHGGNWWRHGSLNSDRAWSIEYTDYLLSEAREERIRNKTEPTPICCAKCQAVRLPGHPCCPVCGFRQSANSRMVVQTDGTLREMTGDILKPRREYRAPDVETKWDRIYWAVKKKGSDTTFAAAMALFAMDNGWTYPPTTLANMPSDDYHLHCPINDVHPSKLNGYAKAIA